MANQTYDVFVLDRNGIPHHKDRVVAPMRAQGPSGAPKLVAGQHGVTVGSPNNPSWGPPLFRNSDRSEIGQLAPGTPVTVFSPLQTFYWTQGNFSDWMVRVNVNGSDGWIVANLVKWDRHASLPSQTRYKPGSVVTVGGVKYLVGADGHTLTPYHALNPNTVALQPPIKRAQGATHAPQQQGSTAQALDLWASASGGGKSLAKLPMFTPVTYVNDGQFANGYQWVRVQVGWGGTPLQGYVWDGGVQWGAAPTPQQAPPSQKPAHGPYFAQRGKCVKVGGTLFLVGADGYATGVCPTGSNPPGGSGVGAGKSHAQCAKLVHDSNPQAWASMTASQRDVAVQACMSGHPQPSQGQGGGYAGGQSVVRVDTYPDGSTRTYYTDHTWRNSTGKTGKWNQLPPPPSQAQPQGYPGYTPQLSRAQCLQMVASSDPQGWAAATPQQREAAVQACMASGGAGYQEGAQQGGGGTDPAMVQAMLQQAQQQGATDAQLQALMQQIQQMQQGGGDPSQGYDPSQDPNYGAPGSDMLQSDPSYGGDDGSGDGSY